MLAMASNPDYAGMKRRDQVIQALRRLDRTADTMTISHEIGWELNDSYLPEVLSGVLGQMARAGTILRVARGLYRSTGRDS